VKLTLDKDATGIIASGSINDIKLVEKLINDQDNPVKQVLLEVYILEVNSGWASSLESTISRTTQTPNTAAATTIVRGGQLGAAALSGGINVSTAFGAKNDITALINLLETNSLGKTISKPSIIVKDTATGTVKKDRTFRQAITSIIQNVAPTPPTIATSYIDIISPLTLTVTPKINKHNDNIDLAFSFTQTKRDNDVSPTSPTSTNNITTNLLIEPGKVIVLAGLKVESEATSSEGMPFLAKLGLEPIFGPLVGLLGGTQALSKSSTELLVIINPTVITSKNIAKTMDKALK
jgi:type II secretory pathway component GspD/PulD (secretin)